MMINGNYPIYRMVVESYPDERFRIYAEFYDKSIACYPYPMKEEVETAEAIAREKLAAVDPEHFPIHVYTETGKKRYTNIMELMFVEDVRISVFLAQFHDLS